MSDEVRFAVVICRDLIEAPRCSAMADLGVNVKAVAALSPDLATILPWAVTLSQANQGTVVIANNPQSIESKPVDSIAVFAQADVQRPVSVQPPTYQRCLVVRSDDGSLPSPTPYG